MSATFSNGIGIAIVGHNAAILTDPGSGETLPHNLRDYVLRDEVNVDVFVEMMSAIGFRMLPSFAAVVDDEQGRHTFARGSVAATIEDASGISLISARHAATWTETLAPTDSLITLHFGDSSAAVTPFFVTHGTVPAETVVTEFLATKFNVGSILPALAIKSSDESSVTSTWFSETEDNADDNPHEAQDDGAQEIAAVISTSSMNDVASAVETTIAPDLHGNAQPAESTISQDNDDLDGLGDGDRAGEPTFSEKESTSVDETLLEIDREVDVASESDSDPTPISVTDAADSISSHAESANEEFTSSYFAHMIEETRYRGIEAAAVRTDPDEHEQSQDAPALAKLAPNPGFIASSRDAPKVPPTQITPTSAAIEWAVNSGSLIEGIPAAPGTQTQPTPAEMGDSHRAGDHDGNTVSIAGIRAIVAQTAVSGPTVQAVHCAKSHPNPVHAATCRECGDPIHNREQTTIRRPSLGQLRLTNGDAYLLDRPMILGRKPSTLQDHEISGEQPRLVALEDADQLLSKVHLEVRVEEWQVLVVDRHSTNHSFITLPDRPMMQLRPGDPTQIVDGTTIDLAGSVHLIYEVSPSS